ncbi:MAG: GMC family oxidoreductase [Archaeoglobaceae archaeon]|nr:GMC family oxidoreductase [Archaeoglobaceae archaeon]MDW8117821.1 GMC family oxidoreductase [Archaeoglobaceae archaeon]
MIDFLKKLGEAFLSSEVTSKYELDEKKLKILFSKLPFHVRILLKLSSLFINLLPILRVFSGKKPCTISSMPVEERTRYLDKLARSRISLLRNSFLILKLLALFLYFEKEEVKKEVGCFISIPNRRVKKPEMAEDSIIEFNKRVGMLNLKCDVAVIGSGAGGAVVAKELSEKGLKVLVIEEGFMHLPKGDTFDSILNIYRNSGFEITLPMSPSQPFILLPSGRCVGGTTVINEGTCFRTPDSVIKRWNSEFDLDIDLNEMHRYFDRIERTMNVHRASIQLIGKASMKIAFACEKLNYSYFPLKKNISQCEALGLCEFGCPIDAKRAMNVSYIPLAANSGAKIYTGMRVKSIDFKGKSITKIGGDIRSRTGEILGKFSVEAKYFVLCAGAIQTPYLLLRNGIANSSGLVGKNLRVHPCFALMGVFEEKLDGWKSISQSLAIDEFLEEGILFEATFLPLNIGLSGNYLSNLSEIVEKWDKIAFLGVMLSDEDSKGSVRVFANKPLIFYNLGKRDLQKTEKAILEGCRILLSAGAKNVITPSYNFPFIRDLSEIKKIAPNGVVWSAYHPQGTCRMSKDPFRGVVDSYGKAHDFDNLYIADASIFPSSVKVNPMVSIMGFAMRTAERISEVENA